jgi:trk system potassium uptake protein TrkA
MEKKEYIVFGLGRFGSSVARQLEKNGCNVLAVDDEEERVQKISDEVTYAVCADVTDPSALEELGVKNFDGAVIAIGQNLEAAVLTTIWLKEQGVKRIVAKAYSELQGKILLKVGADEVVYPEMEMGIHVANNLSMGRVIDTIELTDEFSIVDIDVSKEWIGKSLRELKLRDKFHINVIGVKRDGKLFLNPAADEKTLAGDVFVVIGKNTLLQRLKTK